MPLCLPAWNLLPMRIEIFESLELIALGLIVGFLEGLAIFVAVIVDGTEEKFVIAVDHAHRADRVW